jgi:hypothetical protein
MARKRVKTSFYIDPDDLRDLKKIWSDRGERPCDHCFSSARASWLSP